MFLIWAVERLAVKNLDRYENKDEKGDDVNEDQGSGEAADM